MEEDTGNSPSYSFLRAAWKGVVCPRCGRCVQRQYWNGWCCSTPNCGWIHKVARTILSPQAVREDHEVEYSGHAVSKDTFEYGQVHMRPASFQGNWRIHEYELSPGNVVTHFFANKPINATPGGPNDLYIALQKEDLSLQRFVKLQAFGRIAQLT